MPERTFSQNVRTLTDVGVGAGGTRGALRRGARAGPPLRPRWCGRLGRPRHRHARRQLRRQDHARAGMARGGCDLYSDEFAVLDRAGRVHPFARPLAIRDGSTALTRRVPVAALGAESGTTPLPVGLVLVTSYRAGARWRPRRLTAGPTLLALMRHTVAARGNPAHSMPILKQAVSGSMALAGVRGEAPPLVSAVLRYVRTPLVSGGHDEERCDVSATVCPPPTLSNWATKRRSTIGRAGKSTPSTRLRRACGSYVTVPRALRRSRRSCAWRWGSPRPRRSSI